MRANRLRKLLLLPLVMAILSGAVACNSKSEEETDIVVTSSIVAIKNFYLTRNDSVLKNLDSVFFSIDLEHGVIFNADSLPKGTKVNRLVPSITFANTMTKVELTFLKDNDVDTTVNYLTNSTDSIDFTHPVTLSVTAQDGVSNFTYILKVNVHTVETDTLAWTLSATSPLPSRLDNPVSQKTVRNGQNSFCMIEEADDSFTLSECDNLLDGSWNKQVFNPGFTPDIESFTATEKEFFMLSAEGDLYTSEDALNWAPTGETSWLNILGAYEESVLGLKRSGADVLHTRYPAPENYKETKADPAFPVNHSSALGIIETEWSEEPMALLAGGGLASGEYSSAVWAFDGSIWAIINDDALPAVAAPMMARYVVFRDTPAAFAQREFDAWIFFGGVFSDGTMNRKVYVSLDNGVNWNLAPAGMQLPENFSDIMGGDLLVASYPLSADLSDAWTQDVSSRASYTIEDTTITWNCPYMFVFGGHHPGAGSPLSTSIWRGVLNRLTFTPDI